MLKKPHVNACYKAFIFLPSILLTGCTTDPKPREIGQQASRTLEFWATANLNVTHYRNGDAIAHVPDSAEWTSLTTGAWVYYENDSTNGIHYGRLYNHYALTDPRGICPEGWRVATDDDWEALIIAFGGADSAGFFLKAAQGWDDPNIVASAPSRFNALPSGNRKVESIFNGKGLSAPFWTATTKTDSSAVARYMFHSHPRVGQKVGDRRHALACRCVRQAQPDS